MTRNISPDTMLIVTLHIAAALGTLIYTFMLGGVAALMAAVLMISLGFFREQHSFCVHGAIILLIWAFHIEIITFLIVLFQ